MPTTDIEKLIVSLEARTKEYEKALAKAQGTTVTQLRKIEREAQGFASRFDAKMGMIGGSLKGLLAGASVAAVAAFGAAIKSAISDAASIGDLADKIGLSTDAIQELSYGAVQANISFDDLADSLTKFSRMLAEAQNGSGDLLKTLEANGFDQAAVKALSYKDALAVVADLVKNARNEQDQLLIITQAFGRGGDRMLGFLKNGSDGLRTFAQDATTAGAKIEENLIRKAQEWDDSWAAFMLSMKGSLQDFVLSSLVEIEKLKGALDMMQAKSPTGKMVGRFAVPNSMLNGVGADPVKGVGSAGFSFTPGLPKIAQPTTIIPDDRVEKAAAEAVRDRQRAAEAAARAEVARRKAITDVITALQFESEQLKRSEMEQQVQVELRQAGVTAMSKQGQEIRKLVEANYMLVESEKFAKEAQTAAIEAAQEASDKFIERRDAYKDSLMSLADLGVSAFEAIASGGEKVADVLQNVAKQLASAALQAALLGQGPMAGLFGSSAAGGLFGSLFSGFGGGIPASIYHKGGMVGTGGLSRNVSAATFAGAPRMHSGGIAGLRSGEVPAILQKGEMVLPRGSRSNPTQKVVINNFAGVDVQQSRTSDGGMQFDIRRVVSDVIAGGGANKALRASHGLRQSRVVR